MRKLLLLQSVASAAAFLLGRRLRIRTSRMVTTAYVPILAGGYAFLWWFRNVFFYRDPDRIPPQGRDLILSPADGRVMYVNFVQNGEVISEKKGKKIPISELAKADVDQRSGWLIGIYMTPFDVHFNRAPIEGVIRTVHHHVTDANLPMVDLWEYVSFTVLHRAIDMFSAPFHLENERMTMRIRNERLTCFVILIADQFVNKITRLFEEEQLVQKGEKISFIERGSQTDVFVPVENVSFQVRPGDQVYAGATVLGRIEP